MNENSKFVQIVVKNMRLVKKYHNAHYLTLKGTTYYFSYESLVMVEKDGNIYISEEYHKYSKTTSKHINLFLDGRTDAKIVSISEFKEIAQL